MIQRNFLWSEELFFCKLKKRGFIWIHKSFLIKKKKHFSTRTNSFTNWIELIWIKEMFYDSKKFSLILVKKWRIHDTVWRTNTYIQFEIIWNFVYIYYETCCTHVFEFCLDPNLNRGADDESQVRILIFKIKDPIWRTS